MATCPVTLFAPGPWKDLADCSRRVGAVRGTLDWIPNDGHFGAAFAFGRVDPGTAAAADAAPGAAIIEVDLDLERECAALAAIGRSLAKAGAVGIRVEQSKAAATLPRWIELLESEFVEERYGALVVHLTGGDADTMASCGMHLFARPDAQVEAGPEPDQAGRWLTALACYQIAEDPLLRSGHTFSPDAETPRRPLVRWPDDRYPPDHPCHNPFGVWRAGPAGTPGHGGGGPELVFVPALVAVLLAHERREGRPLRREEVERITSEAAVIAMEPRDVRALELKRGYADLYPELAWDQWQVARTGLAGG